jgi:hypothetical protein
MEANACSKYALKELHQSIGLIDRKITHCRNFESFDSQENREFALRKLSTKRATLVKAVLALTNTEIQHDSRPIPGSSIHLVRDTEEPKSPEETEKSEVAQSRKKRR